MLNMKVFLRLGFHCGFPAPCTEMLSSATFAKNQLLLPALPVAKRLIRMGFCICYTSYGNCRNSLALQPYVSRIPLGKRGK